MLGRRPRPKGKLDLPWPRKEEQASITLPLDSRFAGTLVRRLGRKRALEIIQDTLAQRFFSRLEVGG